MEPPDLHIRSTEAMLMHLQIDRQIVRTLMDNPREINAIIHGVEAVDRETVLAAVLVRRIIEMKALVDPRREVSTSAALTLPAPRIAYIGIEHYMLLWTITARVLIARWSPDLDSSIVTALDILIAILITRVVPPKEQ